MDWQSKRQPRSAQNVWLFFSFFDFISSKKRLRRPYRACAHSTRSISPHQHNACWIQFHNWVVSQIKKAMRISAKILVFEQNKIQDGRKKSIQNEPAESQWTISEFAPSVREHFNLPQY